MRKRRSHAEWRGLIEQQVKSGLVFLSAVWITCEDVLSTTKGIETQRAGASYQFVYQNPAAIDAIDADSIGSGIAISG